MKFTVEMDCDNVDIADNFEESIPRLLRWIANRVEEHSTLSAAVYDRNGNRVGRFGLDTSDRDLAT